jgi:DNA polymerase III epsilon subunit family exonuclease
VTDPFDLDRPLNETTFALFDVETTGLSPAYGHRVCEVACLSIRDGVERGRFESLVDPGRSISAGAFRVNRITPEMLTRAPSFSAIAEPLLALMEDSVLVAHNAPFDLGFLAKELEIARLAPPEGPIIDTLSLSRRIYSSASHSLSAITRTLELPAEPTHRAMSDVQATRHLLDKILHDLGNRWNVTTLAQVVDFQGGPIPYPHPRALPLPPAIAEALESKGRVFMRYVDAKGQETERVVRPLSIGEQQGYLYLTAHCYWRDELRTFRLDRIVEMAVED